MFAVRHRFSKYQGLGNDFVLVEQARFPVLSAALARQLCDRHVGVGADGVLITGLRSGRPFMHVINADGSTPEMCGNGLRCVALYLLDSGLVREPQFEVVTDAGPHVVRVGRQGRVAEVEVAMRPASLEASDVFRNERGRFVEQPFELDGERLQFTAVSMGNPHLVSFDELRGKEALLGPRIERDARLKSGANVGFARVRSPTELELTVWERGVGFTLACGTGACAAAVAAVETGRVARHVPLTVHLPGGALTIRVGELGAPISMSGPTVKVFDGELELHES
jgi:diaminopimelate epimerase